MVIAGGLGLLLVGLLLGRWLGGPDSTYVVKAAQYFIPVWLGLSLINLWVGVSRAGYSVMEEAPVLIVVFGVPAAVAGILWWYFSRG